MAAASTVSSTDVEVFKKLTNTALVDVAFDSKTRRATEDMRQALERAALQKSTAAAAGAPRLLGDLWNYFKLWIYFEL